MAINIDTVYQRVLAIANKEQRGYITPQEFNLFADQAQMEIFEQYFYDIAQYNKVSGNDAEFSDMVSLLEEKISLFEVETNATVLMPTVGGAMIIPDEIYRIGTVRIGSVQVEMLTSKKFDAARFSPLTAPTPTRPIGYLAKKGLYIAVGSQTFVNTNNTANINLSYIKKPAKVEWGYFVINDKALYDSNNTKTTNFELHPSEESELVYRILAYAGITLQKPQLTQIAAGIEGAKNLQEKR